MPVETRAMKRAREALEAQGGNQTGATIAAPTTTAPRAPRKKATGTKGAKGTKGKGGVKGKQGVDKVQKAAKAKKGGVKAVVKAVSKTKQKGKGKQTIDETEKEDPEPEPELEPEPEPGVEPEPEHEPVGKGKVKGKGAGKGKKSVNKVQKATKIKKGGIEAVRKAKQKGKDKGKQAADETEKDDPAAEPEPEPESEPKPKPVSKGKVKGKGGVEGKKGVDKVQKSTKPKKGGIKAVWKAKQKDKGKKLADGAEKENQTSVSKGAGKGKEVATDKAHKTNKAKAKQVQTASKGRGKEKAVAASKGKDEILQRFTRADLQEAGALESDDVEMPTLTNDIHPIWAPEKFRFSSATDETERAEAYAAISPALRLASLWVEQPQYEDFWATMWHGKYLKPGTNARLMRIAWSREDQAKSLKKGDLGERLTLKEFQDLASREEFSCEWRFGQQAMGTWAKTEEAIDGFSGCVTTLHDDFEWLARSPQASTTTSEQLRFYFFLAVNLGRELVQQVCRFKHREQYGDKVEPLDRNSVFYQFADGARLPLDVAWENFMFKGPIRQINSPMSPMAPDGLAVHHIRLQNDSERVFMPVQVDWISERFSKDLWLADHFDEDRRLPGLPNEANVHAKELVID